MQPVREHNTRHCPFSAGIAVQDYAPVHTRRFNPLVQWTILLDAFGLRRVTDKKNATENYGKEYDSGKKTFSLQLSTSNFVLPASFISEKDFSNQLLFSA
jgi:hypothetical protein